MRALAAALLCGAFVLGGCGRIGGGEPADAARERPIPCMVQAHGIDAVEATLRERPERPACDNSVDPQAVPLDELTRIIPDQHPAFYYVLATRLFAANRKDEAVFWYYAGQLRYRIRLACHPDLPPGTEPALFAAMSEEVGRPINEYAGSNTTAWAAAVDRVLEWDERTHNGFEPKAPCAQAIAQQRAGLQELGRYIRQNAARIRAERGARGLDNAPDQ